MTHSIAKVYAAFFPADNSVLSIVQKAGETALGSSPWLLLEGDILCIDWEGIFFPVDEVLEALQCALPPNGQGKLDYLDLEAWTLTRHVFQRHGEEDGVFSSATRGLNHVLEYSGH